MNNLLNLRDFISRQRHRLNQWLTQTSGAANAFKARVLAGSTPDFLIIGAAKAGTTFLSRALNGHPDISLPDKELNFFTENAHKGLDWYYSFFRKMTTPFKGEKSTSYLFFTPMHHYMHWICPHRKIIICLRNPISRAYSNWTMRTNMGLAEEQVNAFNARCVDGQGAICDTSFDALLQAYQHEANLPRRKEFPLEIIERGFYSHQIASVLSFYDPAKVKIVIQERMQNEQQAAYNDILDFIGAAQTNLPPVQRNNKGNYAQAAPLTTALREQLARLYQTDVARLKKMLNDPLTEWRDF